MYARVTHGATPLDGDQTRRRSKRQKFPKLRQQKRPAMNTVPWLYTEIIIIVVPRTAFVEHTCVRTVAQFGRVWGVRGVCVCGGGGGVVEMWVHYTVSHYPPKTFSCVS